MTPRWQGSSVPGRTLALLTLLSMFIAPARGDGLSGSVAVRADAFPESPMYGDQSGAGVQGSAMATLDGFYRLSESLSLDFRLRGTWTPEEQEATFGDVQKGVLEYKAEPWALRAGVLNERWGVMTVEQISDVINQRDYVSDYRGRERLGQPGVALQYYGDSWSLTLVGTTWERERRLARGADRFRYSALGYRDAEMEGGKWSPNLGARLLTSLGDLELELTYFHGLAREPLLVPAFGDDGSLALTPTYRRMSQAGLAGRYVLGDYVLRGEGFLRWEDETYGAAALGVERIFYRAFGGVQDLMVYLEGYYDGRSADAPRTIFDNDLALGLRLDTNDSKGTVFWLQSIYDLETSATLIEFEAKRRLGEKLLGRLELVAPVDVADDPALQGFERDTRISASLTWFF